MAKLTSEEYVEIGGIRCPACGSDNISGLKISMEGASVYQECMCQDCHAEWTDVYELVGYEGLENVNSSRI